MESTESRIAPSPEAESDDFALPSNLSPAEARLYWRGVAAGLARAGAPVPPDIAARTANGDVEEAVRQRHDAFTGTKKQAYLKALAKTGCILDACRLTGISSSTVYNHQAGDPEFARNCQLALDMASAPIELTAYERAVVGVEEDVIRGGKVVGTRMKRSDFMLRILLQGSNPKKYGPRPGFTRKRILKAERKHMEREIRAEMTEPEASFEEAIVALDEKLQHFGARRARRRREEGWIELDCGVSVPRDWLWAGEGDPAECEARQAEKPDSECNSSNSSTSPPLNSSPGFPGEE
ncbi:MAG TPA: hypothetical protein VF605_01390 [Allosphingosinicella sp.]|jgi:hypothetical protein